MADFYDWSTTASSNATADTLINWAEGQNPDTVNDSARQMMARVAALRNDLAPKRTSAGSSNAYTVASDAGGNGSYRNGEVVAFLADRANTSSCTLNVNSRGAIPFRPALSVEFSAGEIRAGQPVLAYYNSATNEWLAVNTGYHVNAMTSGALIQSVVGRLLRIGTPVLSIAPTPDSGFIRLTESTQTLNKSDWPELNAWLSSKSYPWGSASTTFNLPPAAGYFLRFAGTTTGIDPNGPRSAGSIQADAIKAHLHAAGTLVADSAGAHTHTVTASGGNESLAPGAGTGGTDASLLTTSSNGAHTHTISGSTAETGGTETRPKNVAFHVDIFASSALATGTLGAFGYNYAWDAGTTAADPGTGRVRGNNATLASITGLYISQTDGWGVDIGGVLALLTTGVLFRLTKVGAPANSVTFRCSSAAVDNGAYWTIPVTVLSSGSSSLAANDTLAAEIAGGERGQTGASSGIAQTALELAAGVTPTNTDFPPGDLRRYGADPTGVSSSHTAFANACKTGHLVLGGGAYTYLLSTNPGALTTSVVFDGQGCTIKPSGNVYCFLRNAPTATASVSIVSGATKGSRRLVCASVTSISVGQWCKITDAAGIHPPTWTKVSAVDGGALAVSIDATIQHDYSGTLTLNTYAAATILPRLVIRNTIFDGDLSTSANVGEAIRAGGYEAVNISQNEFRNFSASTNNSTRPVVTLDCINVVTDNNVSTNQGYIPGVNPPWIYITDCGSGISTNNRHSGSGFGIEHQRCDSSVIAGNVLSGFRKKEQDDGDTSGQSVRGIKTIFCGMSEISGNIVDGYETPIKSDENFAAVISGNVIGGQVTIPYAQQSAISAAYQYKSRGSVVITNNVVNGSEGAAVVVYTTIAAVVDTVITGNSILNCGSNAIFTNCGPLVASNNFIRNWSNRNVAISNVTNNGSGLFRVTVTSTAAFVTGSLVHIAGVGGITSINTGPWTVTVINGTTLDLQGSIFSGTYTSGGAVYNAEAAIYHSDQGGVITGNVFTHDTVFETECIRDLFGSGFAWEIDNNISPSNNPIIQAGSIKTLASASTLALSGYPHKSFVVTGNVTINSFGGGLRGTRTLRFTGTPTITYGASSIVTPSGSNIQIAAGDVLVVNNETGSGGLWRVLEHHRTNALGTLTLANGANNDVVLPGNRTLIISGPTGVFSVSGFAGGTDGERRTIINPTAQNMTVTNDATSTAANRILTQTGADVTHTGRSSIEIIYSGTDSRWLMIGAQA